MASYTVLLLCIQALLIQIAFSQVITSGINPALGGVAFNNVGLGNAALGGASFNNIGLGGATAFGVPDAAAIAQLPVSGPYGGVGTGELSVAGEVSAAGQTVVSGQVPVIGSVSFSGQIPAGGIVSIAGNCGCGSVAL